MGFNDLLDKIKNLRPMENEEHEMLDDDETRDKYLRSLRRQRRAQMEELEKDQLKKDISEYEKQRMISGLYGIKKAKLTQKARKLRKAKVILKEKQNMLKSPSRKKRSMFLR